MCVGLLDIHGLFGGQAVYLFRESTSLVRIVNPREKVQERRFSFKVPPQRFQEVEKLLEEQDFPSIPLPCRTCVPDEARPTIIVHFSSGKQSKVWKCANDTNIRFDAIYNVLVSIASEVQDSVKPSYSGQWDTSWQFESL